MDRAASWMARVLRQNWLLLLIVGAVAIAFTALRTRGSDVASVAEVEAMLQRGQPTLVEFYSNA
jgi:hypothetical protein